MGKTPDTVVGVLEPYLNRFDLWGHGGLVYETGMAVPAVGMATSYSVQLALPPGTDSRPVFLQVQEGRITNVMALQPLGDKSVFDSRGQYLGRGGQPLEKPSEYSTPLPPDIVTAVRQMEQPTTNVPLEPSPVKTLAEKLSDLRTPAPHLRGSDIDHRFHLRPDFEIDLRLPTDLTKSEAERLALFVMSLPFTFDYEAEK